MANDKPMFSFDPMEVSCILGGYAVESWNSITVAKDEDNYTFSTSSTGQVTRNKNASKLGTLTIVIPQASNDNYALYNKMNNNEEFTISIKDISLSTLISISDCVLTQFPENAIDKEAGTRTWVCKGNISFNASFYNDPTRI